MSRYMLLHIPSGRSCGRSESVTYSTPTLWITHLNNYQYIVYTQYNTFLFSQRDEPSRLEITLDEFEILEI